MRKAVVCLTHHRVFVSVTPRRRLVMERRRKPARRQPAAWKRYWPTPRYPGDHTRGRPLAEHREDLGAGF